MSFLEKHVKLRSKTSKLNSSQTQNTEGLSDDDSKILSPKRIKTGTPKSKKARRDEQTKKRKHGENENIDDQILASLKRLDEHKELSEDEDDIFCKAVAFELKKITNLDEKQRIKAKIHLLATGMDKSTL